jgi:hypothetical protein
MFIPDSNFFIPDPGSRSKRFRIPDPYQTILSILTQKLFLSSRKYDPGCSSRIRILIFYPSRIPDPGVKKARDPGSWIQIRNTAFGASSRFRFIVRYQFVYYRMHPNLGREQVKNVFLRNQQNRKRCLKVKTLKTVESAL